MKDKIASVLIKLYDQGKDAETIKQMGDRVARHLGYDPDDSTYQSAWMSSFTDASLDGSLEKDNDDGFDYTDYSMRQGERGNPDRFREQRMAEGLSATKRPPNFTMHVIDPADHGEYNREGEMARQDLATAADAANELRSILSSDENLPEWVQAKITKAVDYLDTTRDYMKAKDALEEAKKGLYYYVNRRKKLGIGRRKNHPNAPTAQTWKDAASTAKKK